jgi:hypothetical protein
MQCQGRRECNVGAPPPLLLLQILPLPLPLPPPSPPLPAPPPPPPRRPTATAAHGLRLILCMMRRRRGGRLDQKKKKKKKKNPLSKTHSTQLTLQSVSQSLLPSVPSLLLYSQSHSHSNPNPNPLNKIMPKLDYSSDYERCSVVSLCVWGGFLNYFVGEMMMNTSMRKRMKIRVL